MIANYATFSRRGDQWVVVAGEYYRRGDRIEVRRKDGTKSVVVIGECLEQPRGVQRRGDYIYSIQK